MSRPGMDKPAKRLTRELKFRVRVPIGSNFTTTLSYRYTRILVLYVEYTCTVRGKLAELTSRCVMEWI